MSDEFPYPVAAVIQALTESGGVFLAAAAKLRCERTVIEHYVESLPEVQEALGRILENNADLAEVAFLQAVRDGKRWAVDRAISRVPARSSGTRRGNGMGWGGPSRVSELGDCRTLTARIFAATTKEERAELVAMRRARSQEIIGEIAETAEREETRLLAAAKLNQIDGGEPAHRHLHAVAPLEEMDDDELAAELARLRGEGAGDPEGAAPSGLSPALPHVRH